MNVLLQPTQFINERFELPTERLEFMSKDGDSVHIEVPATYIGRASLYVRLLCSVKRKGMVRIV